MTVWISPKTPLTMNSGRDEAPCWARRSRSYDVESSKKQVQPRGVIHDLELDRVRHPLLEQLLADVPERAQERRGGIDEELGDREQDDGATDVDVNGPNGTASAGPDSPLIWIARTTASIEEARRRTR